MPALIHPGKAAQEIVPALTAARGVGCIGDLIATRTLHIAPRRRYHWNCRSSFVWVAVSCGDVAADQPADEFLDLLMIVL